MERQATSNGRSRPACVGMEEVAAIFGWPNYYLPFLVRAGQLKPLGKPPQRLDQFGVLGLFALDQF